VNDALQSHGPRHGRDVIGTGEWSLDAPEALDRFILQYDQARPRRARAQGAEHGAKQAAWLNGATQAFNLHIDNCSMSGYLNPKAIRSILRRQNFACRSGYRDAAGILIRRSLRRVKSR